ncbi:MAG: aromatic-ring-hydroxylating dioxygenase subunit beta [Rhodospirillaceae bacterium]|nr:aromatic-ring-hydroxylating dioxygenase subunit beta [Rhodospirillaceae bacterium]MYB12717.1 aromatic-ring-hydroxylating dioxygenase subunit beta [Rhodospirillaceae bacterium]MYI49456.1 aromatic-ring-hydroxylating dioxygenase subunit beta [Rhodospirillaceae bacterium]
MGAAAERDPSTSSYYVGDAFYRELVEAFTDWDRDELAVADPARRDAARAFLEREARLLDRKRYEDWLALFAPECAYWVPGTPERGDPRREITVAFHDRRQLEDRVYRLRTGYAWSQSPESRTVRSVSNVELFATDDAGIVMARSNFHIAELLDGDLRHWAGWAGHRLQTAADGYSILAKQINLIDCDRNVRNPSLTL